jgi:hypothetical protein
VGQTDPLPDLQNGYRMQNAGTYFNTGERAALPSAFQLIVVRPRPTRRFQARLSPFRIPGSRHRDRRLAAALLVGELYRLGAWRRPPRRKARQSGREARHRFDRARANTGDSVCAASRARQRNATPAPRGCRFTAGGRSRRAPCTGAAAHSAAVLASGGFVRSAHGGEHGSRFARSYVHSLVMNYVNQQLLEAELERSSARMWAEVEQNRSYIEAIRPDPQSPV